MGKITRYCMSEEIHSGKNAFIVCRPSVFGNPYTHIKNKETQALLQVSTRDEAIKLYKIYFEERLKVDEKFKEAWDKLYEAYKKYDEIFLGCFCQLNEECHGDFIAKKLRQRGIKEMIDNIKEKKDD